jgi:hypothetical protein
MDDLLERIPELLSDLPIGFIIFAAAILFSFFGNDDKKKQADQKGRAPSRNEAPRPVATADPYARERREQVERMEPAERPQGGHIFASDERRAREERERQQEEVLIFGGLDFGSRGSMFRDEESDRESQWGKTKYGFDESEWGSTFGEKKNPDPIIR